MHRLLMIAGSALLALTAQASAEGDPVKGEKVFKKCAACHAVGENAKNKVGPQLNGVVGSPWGRIDGFKYSKALIEIGDGKVWDEETLAVYLTKPRDLVPKRQDGLCRAPQGRGPRQRDCLSCAIQGRRDDRIAADNAPDVANQRLGFPSLSFLTGRRGQCSP